MTFRFCDASIIVGDTVNDEQRLDHLGRRAGRSRQRVESVLRPPATPPVTAREERRRLRLEPRLGAQLAEPLDQRAPPSRARCRRSPASTRGRSARARAAGTARSSSRRRRAEVEHAAAELDAGRRRPRSPSTRRAPPPGASSHEPLQPEAVARPPRRPPPTKIRSPRGLEPLARERRDRDRVRRHLALHVERAAAPDLAVAQLARPRVDAPLGRVGEHRVGVREEQQPRPVAAPGDARDEVRPLRASSRTARTATPFASR